MINPVLMSASPNILLFHWHDCGRAIEPSGWPARKPNLLAFVLEGVLFRGAYSCSPACGPLRAAMMTEGCPRQCGMLGLGDLTVLACVEHEVDHADLPPFGCPWFLDLKEQIGEACPETLDRIEEFLSEPHDGPFSLSVGFYETHRNNFAPPEIGIGSESVLFSKTCHYDPEKHDWRHTTPPPWLPVWPELGVGTANLHEGVLILDESAARLLAMLRHRGFDDDTFVLLTTDHGIKFPGPKKTLWEQGTGGFLMLRGPGECTGGVVRDNLVGQLDLMPTIFDALDLAAPQWCEGRSLRPIVQGETAEWRESVFTEQNLSPRLMGQDPQSRNLQNHMIW